MYQRLGRYSVDKKLADGGMGSVYLGRSPDGRQVVLKVPHAQDRDSALALADEARAGMRLRHPGIVETLESFVDGGVSVLVVAFIEGSNLFELRRRAGPLGAAAVAEAGAQLASALDAIHTALDERGQPLSMLHRDVSPNNVLVDTAGQVRLIDLGIVRSAERKSKATMQGMVKGTLRYLAPEILAGGDHSAASDLWALGLTLYEAALGRYALAGDEMSTVRAVMDGSFFTQLARSPLDPALVDALGVLVAPVDVRIRNAKAAAAILSRLSAKLGGGRQQLGLAARGTPTGVAPAAEVTEVTSRNAVGPEVTAPTMLSSRGDVESVFTSNHGRDSLPTLQIPAAAASTLDTAPTIQMPAVSTFETAATIQMGAWQPPASGPVVKPPPPSAMADATAPTFLQLPKVEVSSTPPSAPKPAVQKPHRPPTAPAPSLFLPIVVVDEDGEDIE